MSEYPVYEQHFEVVLVREGVAEHELTTDDFRRVPVVAKDQVDAMQAPAVAEAVAKEDAGKFRPLVATPLGVLTGAEMMARQREAAGGAGKQRFNW